jgi:hypothetical protein
MSAFYLAISPVQEPYDLGTDEQGRSKVQFNVAIRKYPSTGGSDLIEELVKILVDAGVVSLSPRNVFGSTMAAIPSGNGPFLSVIETSGTLPEWIHNETTPAILRPTALIVARAAAYVDARTMARAAYGALSTVHNQTITP